jgi:poly(3-hydroxybutyrate) depolymerase
MLYQIYEAQRSFMEPFAEFAQTTAKLLANPTTPMAATYASNPFVDQFTLPLTQRLSAGYDLMYRLGKDYVKPVFGIQSIAVDGSDVAVFESIAIDKPFCELRHFKA